MEKEAATEAARTAMRAEAARVQQARRSRGVTEAEALASLEGQKGDTSTHLGPGVHQEALRGVAAKRHVGKEA